MRKRLRRLVRGGLTVEGLNSLAGFLGLGNPIGWVVTICLSAGALVVGRLVAARAWAEGVLEPFGTFGYVVSILIIAILALLLIGSAAYSYERLWIARSARRLTTYRPYVPADEGAAPEEDLSPQYHELLTFFVNHLEPVASAQWELQRAILSIGIENDQVRALAERSLDKAPFYNSFASVAADLGSSPARRPHFDELVVSIHNAEFNYKQCIDDTDALARSFGISTNSNEMLAPLWEDWRNKHNELVRAYESIKRDSRFGILFRPLRESKWGNIVPSIETT